MANIPFFDMFAELQSLPELRLKLAGAELSGASIDQSSMSISLKLLTKQPLTEPDVAMVQDNICRVYGFSSVTFDVTCMEAPKPFKADNAPAKPAGKVLMGTEIKSRITPIKELNLDMRSAAVTGKVFAFESRETRVPGKWVVSFDMTDYTGSVSVVKFTQAKEAQILEASVKPGVWLTVKGKPELTRDGKEVQLNPFDINKAEHSERQDTAPVKRVELHLHTKMSNMDALTDTKEVIKQAISWGHPAIAITDHGVAQSFPDAWHAAGGKIKILYGVEGQALCRRHCGKQ